MRTPIRRRFLLLPFCTALLVGSLTLAATAAGDAAQKFPDVLSATVQPRGGDVFDFDVTISSPYDTPARYADAFRVTGPGGKVLGERVLWHDHASEQPFTRDLHGVKVPAGILSVRIQGRDKLYGWGGKTIDMKLPGR